MPDPPEGEPSFKPAFKHLSANGAAHYLAQHLGNQETTLITGGTVLNPLPYIAVAAFWEPDLLIAFDADVAAYYGTYEYSFPDQGKAPDLVLEVASHDTKSRDWGVKREDYAAMGIPEYWRFDEGSDDPGTRLAGDSLDDGGQYQPITIEEFPEGGLQGYSAVLNLNIRWEHGELVFYDPGTNRPIATIADERARADAEREARIAAEARSESAESRVRQLEELLRRQGS